MPQNEQQQEQQQPVFNPNEHLIQLKSRDGSKKDYLPVQWRIVWFRSLCPDGTIDTEEVEIDLDREMEEEIFVWNSEKRRSEKVIKRAKGYARFKATVTDGRGGRASGTKSECAASFGDYIEKAETGATGRALAALGYGTAFAPELSEEHRIVDSPLESGTPVSSDNSNGAEHKTLATVRPTAANNADENGRSSPDEAGAATEQQRSSIGKLCQHLGKSIPEISTYKLAKAQIAQLSAEYRTSRNKAS